MEQATVAAFGGVNMYEYRLPSIFGVSYLILLGITLIAMVSSLAQANEAILIDNFPEDLKPAAQVFKNVFIIAYCVYILATYLALEDDDGRTLIVPTQLPNWQLWVTNYGRILLLVCLSLKLYLPTSFDSLLYTIAFIALVSLILKAIFPERKKILKEKRWLDLQTFFSKMWIEIACLCSIIILLVANWQTKIDAIGVIIATATFVFTILLIAVGSAFRLVFAVPAVITLFTDLASTPQTSTDESGVESK